MEELNTSSAALIENHSLIHKIDLGTTTMVGSNINSDSPKNDVLVPLNGGEHGKQPLCRKSLENDHMVNGKNMEVNDVHKSNQENSTKESEMELDESSKDSKMDVESLNKDDVMDVDFEDHMDVDNDNDQVKATNEGDTGTVKDKSKEVSKDTDEREGFDNKKKECNGDDKLNSEKSVGEEIALGIEENSENVVLEKTESVKNEKALNSLDHDESAIKDVEQLISDNPAKDVLEASLQASDEAVEPSKLGNLEDPLHDSGIIVCNNESVIQCNKDLIGTQESATELDLLFSDLEKNMSSQDTNVTESLLSLSQNLIDENNLNREDINLDCSEKTDLLTNATITEDSSKVPDENSDKLTGSEAILNNEIDGEKLIDDFINFNGSSEKESDGLDRSLRILDGSDSIRTKSTGIGDEDKSLDQSLPIKEDVRMQSENYVSEDLNLNKTTNDIVHEDVLLETQKRNKAVLSQDVDEDELLKDVTSLGNNVEKPVEAMDVDEGKGAAPDESMDVDFEENNDVALTEIVKTDAFDKQNVSSSNEQKQSLTETDIENNDVNKTVCASAVSENTKHETEKPSSTGKNIENTDISDLVSELDELLNPPKGITSTQEHDSSTETIVDEEVRKENTDEVPFGILEATSIPPTEFDSMESAAPNDEDPKEHSSVSNLSELAQNVLNEVNNKTPKKKISVKTIKEEILDFNIKEEMVEESYDQLTFQDNIDIKSNLSSVSSNDNVNKRKKKKKAPILTHRKERRRNKLRRLAGSATSETNDAVSKKTTKKVDSTKKVTPARLVKKTFFPVISLTDKSAQLNKNPAVKRSRASLNPAPVKNVIPNAKKPRLSLPNFNNRSFKTRTGGKRLLRSAGEITEKIQDLVNERPPNKVNSKNVNTKTQVARKSTTQLTLRSVARKRGKPYFRAQREPELIFIDTNVGGQDMDMFINENDDEDSATYYDASNRRSGRYDYPRCSPVRKKIRPCEVVIQRMPVIDRLLPAKKEPEKLEPNICELCDPKRIFLSKSSLADHIKAEHLKNSADTTVIPPVETSKEVDEVKSCSFCKKPFHSKNRLLQHMKTCKNEHVPKKVVNNIPGIDLSNLNKSVTISYAKKNEGTSPSTNHVCKICHRKFLMATGLKSHMKTHKTEPPPKLNSRKPGKLTCDICDKNFQYCSDLVEHMTFHSLSSEKEKDILITNLSKISNVEINVESYVESCEDLESDISDDSSDFSYTERTKIQPLPRMNFSPNKCHECGRVFTIKTVYDRHVRLISKISNLKPPYRCPICDVEMKFRCKLGAHIETHKPQPEEQLICKKCNKTFRCENNLIRHELEHEGKLKVNCQYCSLTFNSMSDLYSHQADCKFKSNEYKCNLCKRVFTAKWRLDLHMKTDEKHGTDPQQPNTYFCDQCGREFKHLSVLKRHVDSRCGTEPLYECPDCDKKYFSQGSLASHKRTQHSTEKNFMCQYCSKDFFTKHQLHRHELRHNPDVRPYRCKYPNCDKTYRQPDSLRAHECEHTGVYPYACEFCGLQFSNVKSLKLHRKGANHWSDVEPNKVVTQACRQKNLAGRKEQGGKQPSEEEELDLEGHEDEPKNLVVNEAPFEGVYGGERVAVPQYSTLQPFTVNHLMHHNQQNSVLVQAAHPLTSYTQAIENYFVIASQQEPAAGAHHHSMMNFK